ncbi:MAG TPA: ferrous iron transport protein B [Pyrinomonadaceae bacterium]|nr:ferrous iron transport protein B [Pyrinomonadaceae bacterium]
MALAGNPNAGKTSLFNALTGLRQKVANFPGVTVERKEGVWHLAEGWPPALLTDLPGLYSLEAASPDEQIACEALAGRVAGFAAPDVIVAAVDATNLERNLYLVTQLLDEKVPLVVALTMVDMAERAGVEIDAEALSDALGVPVVAVNARHRRGLDELAHAVVASAGRPVRGASWRLSSAAEREVESMLARGGSTREDVLRELYSDELPADESWREAVLEARRRLAEADPRWWQEVLTARYEWIESVARKAVRGGERGSRPRATERIDAVLTHKVYGFVSLLLVMLVVFQSIFSWAEPLVNLIEGGVAALGGRLRASMSEGPLTDLLVDGVIAGVGGVLVFLPPILLLFFFIAVLEDSGYMSRAAFLLDRLMRGAGLHGKAFMPLLSSFACAIPGIMATRTIENPKDRLATIMIAPFMSCSARMPVYMLMIAAFFADQTVLGVVSVGALLILAMYLLGIAVAVAVAWVLKHTILKAPPPPLVLELPPYRVPSLVNILQTMRSRAWLFVKRAGTIILAISILLWALMAFPRPEGSPAPDAAEGAALQTLRETGVEARGEPIPGTAPIEGEDAERVGEQLRNSYAGRFGRLIEPFIEPLGFDWKIGIGLISSFAARETLVSTLGIVYNTGKEANEESDTLREAIRGARRPDGRPVWTPLVAVSLMVFFVLACQCMSTVAIVRRETNSWRWPLFMVAYMLVLAYAASFVTYQGGRLLGLG